MIVPSLAHDRGSAIGHQSFLAQSRHAASHEIDQLVFLTRLRPIGDDDDNATH